jgi:hypothetical protein
VSEAGGAAVAVWQGGTAIYTASRDGAGPFGPPQLLADEPAYFLGSYPMEPTVVLGPGGQAVALWTQARLEPPLGSPDPAPRVERRVVRAADRAPDGTWSAAYDLGSGAARQAGITSCGPWQTEPPAVAIDGAGAAVVVWESWLAEFGRSETMWSARPAGGAWAAPTLLTAGTAFGVRLQMDASGTAHAAWIRDRALRSARRPAGGAFGPAEVVGPATGGAVELEVDGAGRSIAVWQASGLVLSAATRPAGGPWSAPTALTALVQPPGPEVVDTRIRPPAARLLTRVRISRQTLRRPVCALDKGADRRGACRMAGAALTFRLTAPGEVRVTIQRRGKGRALRALRLTARAGSHRILLATRPLPAGRYTVKIRLSVEGRVPEVAAKQLVVRPA